MTTYRLHAEQRVPRPLDGVFAFFSRPDNLVRLTPPSMGIEFRTADREMREGLRIEYRLRPLFGVPVTWETLIDEYDPPRGFRDLQLRGPYRRWEHRHTFLADGDGTRIIDDIEYALPLGPLGRLAHTVAVRNELERIFRFRAHVVDDVFAVPASNERPLSVAVAGGTGFVGGAIAQELYERGHRVVALSRSGEAGRGPLPDQVAIRTADASSSDGLVEALAGVEALVIALAFDNLPMESPRRGQTFMQVDAEGTERLVRAAAQAGVRRLLYLSGAGAAPDADRVWFRAKWRAEEAVRGSGIEWTIIRPTWVYGPRDVSLNRYLGFARRFGMVPMTNLGRQRLAPVFVDDVGRLGADSLEAPEAAGQVFELGGPDVLSMREIIATALRVAGLRRPILPGPEPLIKLAAWPLRFLPRPPLTPDAVDFIDQPATVDNGPLLARMPRRLTPFAEGLATYLGDGAGPASLTFDRPPAR